MKPSQSNFHRIRSLRYHTHTWGDERAPKIFLLHGWMDVGASFQFLVDSFRRDWFVIAPDWRGFGQTEWAREGYWFPDYYADLDALIDLYSPGAPVNLVGHSMGGNVACTYSGIRPQRVARLVSLEGFGFIRMLPEQAPSRFRRWLDEQAAVPTLKPYRSLFDVAERMMKNNPRLKPERAQFLAAHWASLSESGDYVLRADPRHKRVNPVQNRVDEHLACWRQITAPVLWIAGDKSESAGWKKDTAEQIAERKAAIADLRETLLEDAGHMMHHDQPEKLAQVIEDFFNE